MNSHSTADSTGSNDDSRDNDQLTSKSGRSFFFRKGERYTMRVTQVMDFGAILECSTGQRGFVHVSELSRDKVSNIRSVVSEGQEMEVECLQDGASGKMSRRVLLSTDRGDEPAAPVSALPETASSRTSKHHARRSSASWRRSEAARHART